MTPVRIAIPEEVRAGEPFEVKTLITHPMETGRRPDAFGNPIAQNLITTFSCHLDGQLVFQADLDTGIAANPYLSFFVSAERNGTLEFRWSGQRGFDVRETRTLRVTGTTAIAAPNCIGRIAAKPLPH